MGYQGDLPEQEAGNQEGFIGAKEPDSVRERFKQIAAKNEEVESWSEYSKRLTSQIGARAYETVAGFPGNFKKAFLQTREFLEGGKEGGLAEKEEQALGKSGVENYLMNPPTSSDIREIVTPAIAEKMGQERNYLEPRGEGEKAAGELTQDLTSFFMPGTGQLRMAVRIGAPIAGNLTKQGAKYLGAEEKEAEQAKLGVMLMTTIAGQSNPAQFAQQRIANSINMIPETATVNALPFANLLMPLYRRVTSGLGVPSKSRATQGMRDLAGQVQNGRIGLRTLMNARNDINEWIAEAGGFDVPAAVRDRTIANLNELKRHIIDYD